MNTITSVSKGTESPSALSCSSLIFLDNRSAYFAVKFNLGVTRPSGAVALADDCSSTVGSSFSSSTRISGKLADSRCF